ncbi:MAG TPA: DUF3068 domain-containing protein [Flexivirga sp.]|uniref:DUF3068 domain-containing protein n=1 Tax=Flexivirga sp. TaxID=1962927 RepID=UPI002B7F1C15|nr:DUF3068 domain-containing protein [Flexivirga sp.]HWC21932.1 DUF3068 domain-containing protein [Flexivirga sp.]
MRKSAIVIGFGAFFVTMALLLKFYAFDKLAVIPIDQNTKQVAVDKNAYLFDAGTLKFQHTTLTTTIGAVAQKDESKKFGHNAVIFSKWQYSKIPETKVAQQGFTEKFAVDRHTGKVVKWSGDSENEKAVEHKGYTVKFPFGAKKTTYPYWDGPTEKTMNMKYAGTDKIDGLEVYRYEGTVPRQSMTNEPTMDSPGFLFGGAKSSPGVHAKFSYSNDRIIWVEPQTGAFIKVSEGQKQWLTNPKNNKSVQVLRTTSVFDDATVKSNVDEYKGKASQLKALKIAPWALGILGILLLIGGALMAVLMGRRNNDADYDDDYEYDDDTRGGVSGLLDDNADDDATSADVLRRHGRD